MMLGQSFETKSFLMLYYGSLEKLLRMSMAIVKMKMMMMTMKMMMMMTRMKMKSRTLKRRAEGHLLEKDSRVTSLQNAINNNIFFWLCHISILLFIIFMTSYRVNFIQFCVIWFINYLF